MKKWYEELYENYSNRYDEEIFTKGTLGECDFIESEINYNKSLKILDVGCGTGRHSIELTKRGYKVVGVDLSESQLKRAKEKSRMEGLTIEFIKQDARNLQFENEFDVAIMLCEGSFPLMETDEMNFDILKSITNSLNKNGKFIFTTLNGLFPLFHSVKDFVSQQNSGGNSSYIENTFDLLTFRENSTITFVDDLGNEKELLCNERYYVPSEISWMLKLLAYKTVEIFGAKLGAFNRKDKLTTEDYEMLVVAQK